MKIRFFSPKYLLTLAVLCPLLVSAVEPKTWNFAYAKESPLDVEVSTLIEEINTPSVRPSFGSLKKIYSNTYKSVPAIRKTTAELNGLRMGVAEKEGKLYPRLTLQTNSGQSSVDYQASKANDQAGTTTLAADQLLYDFGATSSEIAAAKTRLAAGMDKVEAERLRVLFSMVTAQLELQAAKKLIVFYGSNEKSRQQFFDLIQEKLNLGASSALDLARANTKLLESKAKIPGGDLKSRECRPRAFWSSARVYFCVLSAARCPSKFRWKYRSGGVPSPPGSARLKKSGGGN